MQIRLFQRPVLFFLAAAVLVATISVGIGSLLGQLGTLQVMNTAQLRAAANEHTNALIQEILLRQQQALGAPLAQVIDTFVQEHTAYAVGNATVLPLPVRQAWVTYANMVMANLGIAQNYSFSIDPINGLPSVKRAGDTGLASGFSRAVAANPPVSQPLSQTTSSSTSVSSVSGAASSSALSTPPRSLKPPAQLALEAELTAIIAKMTAMQGTKQTEEAAKLLVDSANALLIKIRNNFDAFYESTPVFVTFADAKIGSTERGYISYATTYQSGLTTTAGDTVADERQLEMTVARLKKFDGKWFVSPIVVEDEVEKANALLLRIRLQKPTFQGPSVSATVKYALFLSISYSATNSSYQGSIGRWYVTQQYQPQATNLSAFDALMHNGARAFAAKDYAGAEREFTAATVQSPNLAIGHLLLGQAQFALAKYKEAYAALQKGILLDPNWPRESFRPAELYGNNVTDFAAHTSALQEKLETDDMNPHLLFVSGYEFWFNGRKEEASPILQRVAAALENPDIIQWFLQALPPRANL